ncbi:MAG: pilus assembly protein PilM [Sedimentisphaerales bacterium]|nr:pilus assembly protein PilM [Sedimentisphaerales bacterium]
MISWKFKIHGVCPIGLDIGYSSVKMIQLAVNGGHRSVIAAAKTDIDPTLNGDREARRSFVISAVKRMLANGGFRGRNVVSCLSNDSLKIASLRLGQADDVKIGQAVKKEMQPRFGLDPDKDIVHYIVAGDVRHGDEVRSELILLAVDSETVKNHIDMLTEVGLRPVAVDAIPCALFRGFERLLQRQEDREQTAVFVDVGSRFTTVVFGRVGEISFIKQVPIGSARFDQEVAAKLGVDISGAQMLRRTVRAERSSTAVGWGLASDKANGGGQMQQEQDGAEDSFGADLENSRPFDGVRQQLDASTRQAVIDAVSAVAEELAKEISLCFRYYTVTFRGRRVERAVFAGGGAYEDILLNVLRRQLAVEIELAQPLKGFDLMNMDFGSDRRGLLCEWAVAVGLSLKGVASGKTAEGKTV